MGDSVHGAHLPTTTSRSATNLAAGRRPAPTLFPVGGGRGSSGPVDGVRTDPAGIGVHVDIAAAHNGGHVPAVEAVTVFEDRRDAERGRRFDDETGVVQKHPHTGD